MNSPAFASLIASRVSKTPAFADSQALPDKLPPLPELPSGFDRWIYRGINYASPVAIMVTSFELGTDGGWDPPMVFKTDGMPNTHYVEAVVDHHWICKCSDCQSVNS